MTKIIDGMEFSFPDDKEIEFNEFYSNMSNHGMGGEWPTWLSIRMTDELITIFQAAIRMPRIYPNDLKDIFTIEKINE